MNRVKQGMTMIGGDLVSRAVAWHQGGKLAMAPVQSVNSSTDLSLAYTPGVAEISRMIAADASRHSQLTWTGRLVAVISNGTAVLGLGDVGVKAVMPVLEGKAQLFQQLGGFDAIPLVIDEKDPDRLVDIVLALKDSFGALNLEDIAAPMCFEIERRLVEALPYPVIHDDQHVTAVVVLAGMFNAAALRGTPIDTLKVVVAGAGAAGIAIANLLYHVGVRDIRLLDSRGMVTATRGGSLTVEKANVAERTTFDSATVVDAFTGADLFIGVSGAQYDAALIDGMALRPMVFALSNPDPEFAYGDMIQRTDLVATGRSDLPNQINNVLGFPGIFSGLLDSSLRRVTTDMLVTISQAIAVLLPEPSAERFIPHALDSAVPQAIATALAAHTEQEKDPR